MGKNKTSKKKLNPWLKGIFIFSSVLLCIVLIGIIAIYRMFGQMEQVSVDKSDLSINYEEVQEYETHEEIINIALFGIDSEDGVTGRSDAIMVATIDPVHKKLKLTSIMRDSYVNISDIGMDKINHAYAFGGPQLAIKTINDNFGLDIEDYMSVNFTSLPIIINSLGGVEINITDEEVSHIPGIDAPGTYNLTGEQALSYSRIRYASGNDYARTERQRTVLNALFNKAMTLNPTEFPGLLNTILPYVQTNMGTNDVLALSTKALAYSSNGLAQDRFPRDGYCEGSMIDGIFYLTFDRKIVKEQIMDYIFDDK